MKKAATPNAQIIQICRDLHMRGLVSAYGGNVSLKMSNKIIITPKGCSFAQIEEDDLVVIDFEGEVLFGAREPSSETLLHLAVYRRRPDVFGIVHTHPPAATAFAYAGMTLAAISPDSHHLAENIPLVPEYPGGSAELAQAVGETSLTHDVILLEKHGMVTLGDDLFKAYHLAEMAEDNALMNLYIRLLKQDAPDK